MNIEELREKLLRDVYAGSFSGLDAVFLDENEIKKASDEELKSIARRYGYQI